MQDGEGSWLEEVVCPIRALYVGQSETKMQGQQLSAGLPQPGLYSLLVRLHVITTHTVVQCSVDIF